MFFQAGSTNNTPPASDPSSGYGGGKEGLDFVKSQEKLSEFSNQILGVFTQGRERVYELQTALADTTPKVARLGGNIKDVAGIIIGVAEASARNVVATDEQITKLYAATQVLGGDAKTLATTFLDVGMSIKSIPESLEESIQYIQSIGGNAKQVMGDVTKNMSQMNRFQFEDGVKGLTKMAAQASMLEFTQIYKRGRHPWIPPAPSAERSRISICTPSNGAALNTYSRIPERTSRRSSIASHLPAKPAATFRSSSWYRTRTSPYPWPMDITKPAAKWLE